VIIQFEAGDTAVVTVDTLSCFMGNNLWPVDGLSGDWPGCWQKTETRFRLCKYKNAYSGDLPL
jgi:hypothetical protein